MYFSELSPWGGGNIFFHSLILNLPPLSDKERGRYCCSCLRKVFIFLSHGILLTCILTYILLNEGWLDIMFTVWGEHEFSKWNQEANSRSYEMIDWLIDWYVLDPCHSLLGTGSGWPFCSPFLVDLVSLLLPG